MTDPPKRLLALSGPSCVGKGPLLAAAAQFHPEFPFESMAVIKSTQSRGGRPRPDESEIWEDPDYFRSREEIVSLRGDRYLHAMSHGFPQALDLQRILAARPNQVVLEATHTLTRQLKSAPYLAGVDVTTLFVSPLSRQEIAGLHGCGVDLPEFLKGLMARQLLARAAFHGKPVDRPFLDDAVVRSGDAVDELRLAHTFDLVLISRDGEGAPAWNRRADGRFLARPTGHAGATLDGLLAILAGRDAETVETWTTETFQETSY